MQYTSSKLPPRCTMLLLIGLALFLIGQVRIFQRWDNLAATPRALLQGVIVLFVGRCLWGVADLGARWQINEALELDPANFPQSEKLLTVGWFLLLVLAVLASASLLFLSVGEFIPLLWEGRGKLINYIRLVAVVIISAVFLGLFMGLLPLIEWNPAPLVVQVDYYRSRQCMEDPTGGITPRILVLKDGGQISVAEPTATRGGYRFSVRPCHPDGTPNSSGSR